MRAIITFHSIDDSGSVLSYPAARLARLLAGLERGAMPVVDLDTLLRPETNAGVALTFDDGMQSVFTAALPLLRDRAIPAHLFLTTGAVGGTNRWPGQPAMARTFDMLRWNEIECLHRAGIRIEAHTASHPDLRQLPDAAVVEECSSAEATIAARLGRPPRYFAYPYGLNDARTRALVGDRYRACLTTTMRPLRSGEALASLPRIDSYYLRPDAIARNPVGRPARIYLALRAALRQLRGQA
jgi:peptidoglycan/xylan/chitin deacetylase (PgdA/CDA1 family)